MSGKYEIYELLYCRKNFYNWLNNKSTIYDENCARIYNDITNRKMIFIVTFCSYLTGEIRETNNDKWLFKMVKNN